MEGLIPLVYRAIVQYRNGEQQGMMSVSSWLNLNESPSASYVRLPGDSGRFQMPDTQLLITTTSSSSPSSSAAAASTRRLLNSTTTASTIQSQAACHLNTRRAVK